uniref:Minor capsid protein VP2 n=2 Tax=Hamster polyomavirus TaxID=1891729 RepID=VP2_POVHA|nr:RecName: Full=Minor capsid protein VP2; AltName: Full=Minor structural protein VP2 [Alphapolyomavirus mauratus]AAA67121.1 VP2 [Alphapolyomavirus mauratus]CAB59365.1 VP2 protein [Alphapolyomavirus mauratus]
MGSAISVIIEMISYLSEISSVTGISVEAILSGEAFAAIDAQVTSLITMEGFLGAETALSSIGLSEDMFIFMQAAPELTSTVMTEFVRESVQTAFIFQTVAGSAAFSLGSLHGYLAHEVPIVNRNMALIPRRPADYYDILFPGVQSFTHALDVIHGWGHSLFQSVGEYIWDTLRRETQGAVESAVRDLSLQTTHQFLDAIARMMENSRWVVTNLPREAYSRIYGGLQNYYAELPGINPAQRRQIERALEYSNRPSIEDANSRQVLEAELGRPDVQRRSQQQEDSSSWFESGANIMRYFAPGGAHQRVTPDWMLPLILGLYGDISPTWQTYIDEVEYGPKKKKRRFQ